MIDNVIIQAIEREKETPGLGPIMPEKKFQRIKDSIKQAEGHDELLAVIGRHKRAIAKLLAKFLV